MIATNMAEDIERLEDDLAHSAMRIRFCKTRLASPAVKVYGDMTWECNVCVCVCVGVCDTKHCVDSLPYVIRYFILQFCAGLTPLGRVLASVPHHLVLSADAGQRCKRTSVCCKYIS